MSTRRNGLPSSLRSSKLTKFTPEDNDIIIPVMGPIGAGKSTFINFIAGKEVARVGHDLKSCTAELQPIVIDSSRVVEFLPDVINSSQGAWPNARRLVLVDTPGFGDTYVDDAEILRLISYWLETMYGEGKTKLAGVIYLHDISLERMLGTTRKNLDIFQKLCGDGALRNVVLCTTKWSDTYEEDGERRTEQLREYYWKEMIAHGSTVCKFEDSHESAWEVVKLIVNANHEKMEALQIREELVDTRKLIPDTEAGRQLRYSLDQLLTSLKQASSRDSSPHNELNAQIEVIRRQIEEMRIPVTPRVLGVLDLGVDRMLNIFTLTNRMSRRYQPRMVGSDCRESILLPGESLNGKETNTRNDQKITSTAIQGPDVRPQHPSPSPGQGLSEGPVDKATRIVGLGTDCCESILLPGESLDGKETEIPPISIQGTDTRLRPLSPCQGSLDGRGGDRVSTDSEPTMGRIDTLSIPLPRTISSFRSQVMKSEGFIDQKIQLFEDTDGKVLMNDDYHIPLQAQAYPGKFEEEPIAVICTQESQKTQGTRRVDPRFSRQIKGLETWNPDQDTHPDWLPIQLNKIMYTDGIKTKGFIIGEPSSYSGYIAMDSDGQKGFVYDGHVVFC